MVVWLDMWVDVWMVHWLGGLFPLLSDNGPMMRIVMLGCNFSVATEFESRIKHTLDSITHYISRLIW